MTEIAVDELYSQFNAGYEKLAHEIEVKGHPVPDHTERQFRLCLYNGDVAIAATLGADGPHHIDIMTRAENMARTGIQRLFQVYANHNAFEKSDYVREPSLALFAKNRDAGDERFYIGQESPQLKHHLEQVHMAWQGHEGDVPYGMIPSTAAAFDAALKAVDVDPARLENEERDERWGARYNLQRGDFIHINNVLDAQESVVSTAPDLYTQLMGEDVRGTSSVKLVQSDGLRGVHIELYRPRDDEDQVVGREAFERTVAELERLDIDLSGDWEVTVSPDHFAFNQEINRYFEGADILKDRGAA